MAGIGPSWDEINKVWDSVQSKPVPLPYANGGLSVTTPELTEYTTTNRLLITDLYHGLAVKDITLNKAMVYIGDGTTNVSTDWRNEQQYKADGRALVSSGPLSGTTYTQTITGLAGTRTRLTFNPPIDSATISVRPGTSSAPDADEAILFCVDAATTQDADDNLTETNIAPRLSMRPNDPPQPYEFSSPVTYLDFKGVGTTIDLDVTVMGVVV